MAVGGLATARELSVLPVELYAEADQVGDPSRREPREHLDGVRLAESGSGGERVFVVPDGRIVGVGRGGDAALSVAGVALFQVGLGDDQHASVSRGQAMP